MKKRIATSYLLISSLLFLGCPEGSHEAGDLPVAKITRSDPSAPSQNNRPKLFGEAEINTIITFYASSDCSEDVLGGGPAAAFVSPSGIEVEVPENTITKIYAAARREGSSAQGDCSAPFEYTEDSTAPSKPMLTATVPPSPSNFNNPSILGFTESNASVFLYLTSDCTGAASVSTDADSKGMFSLSTTVSDDSTTAFYVNAMDEAGNTSECSDAMSYQEDSTGPADPVVITNSNPLSPSQNNSVRFSGTASADVTRVKLYFESTCTTEQASGLASDFTSGSGIEVTVPGSSGSETTTIVYAKGSDALNNDGPCSSSGFSYTHDLAPPPSPELFINSPDNDNIPFIWITSQQGNTIQIFNSNNCTGLSINGTITEPSGQLVMSAHFVPSNTSTQFTGRAIDPAGNISECTSPIDYEEDSIAPAAPTITASNPSSPGYDRSPVIIGTSSGNGAGYIQLYASSNNPNHTCPNSPLTIFRGYAPVSTPGGIFSENYSIEIEPQFPTGVTYYIRAKAFDRAGNASPCSSDMVEYRALSL